MVVLWIAAALVALLVALFLLMGFLGGREPETHTATLAIEVAKPRGEVWTLLDDVEAFPGWLPGITKVEMMPAREGRRTFRQHQGRNSFVMEEVAKQPGTLVTRTIADDHGYFSGRWEHRFEDAAPGRTRLTLTEVGTIKAKVPRAVMRYTIGYDYYLRKFAAALRAKCGT